ncbi:MAG TPA: hypothetical protein VHO01_06350 [Jatrophihabitans sp.]|nr:hypothetical protein [Jatrophihabitans sp.]
MIVRIIGEGQLDVPAEHLHELNELDTSLAKAVAQGNEPLFAQDLARLLDRVRELGTPLPHEQLSVSDFILPSTDASLSDVQALLGDDGLIPG